MFLEKYRLDGKVALITGGTRGIGLSIAHALGEAGAKLVLTNRTNTNGGLDSLKKANYDVSFFEADLHDRSIPQKTIDYEVGYKQALTKRSAMTVSTYYREMKDLIQITAINYAYPVNYLTFGNLDKALVKGFSLKYDLRPINSNVSLNAGYTLQFADGTGSSPVSSASLILSQKQSVNSLYPILIGIIAGQIAPIDLQRRLQALSVSCEYGFLFSQA